MTLATYPLRLPRWRLQHEDDAANDAVRVLELRLDCDLSDVHDDLITSIEATPTDWLVRVQLPRSYIVRLEAQDQAPTYKAFPGIHVPKVLQGPGWRDESWGNDACAKSVLFMDDSPTWCGRAIQVWVGYFDPEAREVKQGPRFLVVAYADYVEELQAYDPVGFSDEDELGAKVTEAMKALEVCCLGCGAMLGYSGLCENNTTAHGALPGDNATGC